jgi:hypothetical protein
MGKYTCIYICVYTNIYIHTYIHTIDLQTHTHTYIHTYISRLEWDEAKDLRHEASSVRLERFWRISQTPALSRVFQTRIWVPQRLLLPPPRESFASAFFKKKFFVICFPKNQSVGATAQASAWEAHARAHENRAQACRMPYQNARAHEKRMRWRMRSELKPAVWALKPAVCRIKTLN